MIATTSSSVSYTGNASTVTTYPIAFPLASAADLGAVSTLTATGAKTTLAGGQFTFTPTTDGNGRITGGSVTTNPAIAATSTVEFKRATPLTQTLDMVQGSRFGAESVESAIDKIVMLVQELERERVLLTARVLALEP